MTDNIKQAIAETVKNNKSYLGLFEDMTIKKIKAIEKCMEDVAMRYHELMTEKPFKELPKVGDKLIAIDECIMDNTGKKTLTIGEKYLVLDIDEYEDLTIKDDLGRKHYFDLETLHEYFKPAL